jgi:hypothetical protein
MEPIDQENDSIRRYLLGQVSDEEGQRLEERFMTDGEYREEVLILEEDLIDDYLSETLSSEEKEAFEKHWLPYHADRLEIAKGLNSYAAEPAYAGLAASETTPRVPGRVLTSEKFNRRPLVIGAIAAGLLFLILGGLWLLFRQSGQENRGRFHEELARLNERPSGIELSERPVALSPVTLRGAEVSKINPADRGPVVPLLLMLPPDQHNSYQVILRITNPPEEYRIENLDAVSTSSGRAVLFKVPSALLAPGQYSLEVRGRTNSGSFESVADYSLQVSN